MTDREGDGPLDPPGACWNLGDLYRGPDDPRLDDDQRVADEEARKLSTSYRGRIGTGELSPQELAEALVAYERVLEISQRAAFYASLLFAADTQSPAAQALDQRTREASTTMRSALVFFELEIQAMPDEPFRAALDHPALAPYRHFLELARRQRPHTLSEPEEKILNERNLTGRSAFIQLHDELSGSLRFEIEVDGERQELTDGEVLALLYRPERELRRRALETFLGTYRRHELVLTSVFNNLLLDHRVETDLRRFPSIIAPRHLDNDIEPETVEAMIEATDRHYGDIQEYFRLKARLLGLDGMTVSDVYAPLGDELEDIPYPAARDIVLSAFGGFDGELAELARQFFDRSWIDAEVRAGKRHGAFCASWSPRHHPYVLTSYTGTTRDVSTLAHEIGHGVHSLLAGQRPLLVFDAPLVLAETASVFAEMLLTDHWLQRASSPAMRARILCDTLDEIYGTIFRQNALTRFELAAHEARRHGRLTAVELGDLWLETQTALFGDAVQVPEIYRSGWIYIPHFIHSPFYCYSYSFGDLLVLALFERYRQEGRSFVPAYRKLLESGGSDSPSRLLATIGFDISRAEFWETGFRAIRRLIDDLRENGDAAPFSPLRGAQAHGSMKA